MPDGSPRIPYKSTFGTLERETQFKNPPKDAHTVPILHEFVTPHLESFNALFDDSGLPQGDGDGKGLLSLGIKDIGERVVFDGKGEVGSESGQKGWGNRLTSTSIHLSAASRVQTLFSKVWYEQISIARPMVSDRDQNAKQRKVFPTEVSPFLPASEHNQMNMIVLVDTFRVQHSRLPSALALSVTLGRRDIHSYLPMLTSAL